MDLLSHFTISNIHSFSFYAEYMQRQTCTSSKLHHCAQYYDNNDDIYDDGINMNRILFISRIIYSLLNKANHVKVEDHMTYPLHLTSLSITHTQSLK